jgi:hypothetical protein
VEVYPWIRSFGGDVTMVRPVTAAARKAVSPDSTPPSG